jgi:N-formylmaleamate deformylase
MDMEVLDMYPWVEDNLWVNDIRLHYFRSGGEKPPLVLVHGFTDNALYWKRTAQVLAQEWDVIMYDARGHGTSDRAPGDFGNAERVGDLVGVIQGLHLHKPGLLGHSMGAATIALAAAQHPALPRFVILEDPAWYERASDESAEQAAGRAAARIAEFVEWREWVRGLQTGTREFGLAQIRAHSPNWSEQDRCLSLNARLQMQLTLFDTFQAEQVAWREVVTQIRCPILLIIGEDKGRGAIVAVEQAEEAASLWRQGRWVQIQGAGHSIRYDQFGQYMEVVQQFLREVREAE